jgi:hypothetical protein
VSILSPSAPSASEPTSAPAEGEGRQVARNSLFTLRKSSSSQLAEYFSLFSSELKAKEDKLMLAKSRAELLMLSMKIKRYRDSLQADQLQEFNTLWGLDADGNFLTPTEDVATLAGRFKALFGKTQKANVKEAVLMDLKHIHEAVQTEERALVSSNASKHEIGKKLLFLFQCDLLPGISGKILEAKSSRDTTAVKRVSYKAKIAGWTFLFLMDAGMMFYIFLFALTQTGPKQNAWFQSFALWLVMEILLVSTATVYFTHILVPSLVMKDLTQIKRRLMDNIRDFNNKVHASKDEPANFEEDTNSVSFNAANYLFVSTRLARQFPNLKESKIIAQFSTPWPRQSYLRVQNVSQKYSKKFSAVTRSASILLIFFVGNFLSVPPSCQDILVQLTSTTAIGYIVLIHVQLFEIFPALVILPSLVVGVLLHFMIQSSKADAKMKLARLFPARGKRVQVRPLDDTVYAAKAGEAEAGLVESKDDASPYDSGESDTEAVPAHAGKAAHRTRRQSIHAGLALLHTAEGVERHSGSASSDSDSDSESSDSDSESRSSSGEGSREGDNHRSGRSSSDEEDSGDEHSEEEGELHLPAAPDRASFGRQQRRSAARSGGASSISVISSGGSRARGHSDGQSDNTASDADSTGSDEEDSESGADAEGGFDREAHASQEKPTVGGDGAISTGLLTGDLATRVAVLQSAYQRHLQMLAAARVQPSAQDGLNAEHVAHGSSPTRSAFVLPAGTRLDLPSSYSAALPDAGSEAGTESDAESSDAEDADPQHAIAADTDGDYQLVTVLPVHPGSVRASEDAASDETDGARGDTAECNGSEASGSKSEDASDMDEEDSERASNELEDDDSGAVDGPTPDAHRRGAVRLAMSADAPEEFSANYGDSSGSESQSGSDLGDEEDNEMQVTKDVNNSNDVHIAGSLNEGDGKTNQGSVVGQGVSAPVQRRVAAAAIPSYASPTASMLAIQLASARNQGLRGGNATTATAKVKTGKTGKVRAEAGASPRSSKVLSKKASKK